MQDIIKQLQPHIVELLVTLLAALGAFVKAWLAARTEAQRQAVLGAALHVEATAAPASDGAAKKAAAIQMAAARLPGRLGRDERKLGALVEDAMPAVVASRSSMPPKAD